MSDMVQPEIIDPFAAAIAAERGDPVPLVPSDFVTLAAERGWRLVADRSFEWTDPETGEVYPATWDVQLIRDELIDGQVFYWQIEIPPSMIEMRHPSRWNLVIDLGNQAWDALLVEHGVTSSGASAPQTDPGKYRRDHNKGGPPCVTPSPPSR